MQSELSGGGSKGLKRPTSKLTTNNTKSSSNKNDML